MPLVPLSMEDRATNMIRSYLGTLRAYLLMSMRLHGGPTESASLLAVSLGEKVTALEASWPEVEGVAKYAAKFREFVLENELIVEE